MSTNLETAIQVRVRALPVEQQRAHGVNREQAAELRARLSAFAEDWDDPEMDIYDDYDDAKAVKEIPYAKRNAI